MLSTSKKLAYGLAMSYLYIVFDILIVSELCAKNYLTQPQLYFVFFFWVEEVIVYMHFRGFNLNCFLFKM